MLHYQRAHAGCNESSASTSRRSLTTSEVCFQRRRWRWAGSPVQGYRCIPTIVRPSGLDIAETGWTRGVAQRFWESLIGFTHDMDRHGLLMSILTQTPTISSLYLTYVTQSIMCLDSTAEWEIQKKHVPTAEHWVFMMGAQLIWSGWCFGTCFFSIYWECQNPNWLSYFSEG